MRRGDQGARLRRGAPGGGVARVGDGGGARPRHVHPGRAGMTLAAAPADSRTRPVVVAGCGQIGASAALLCAMSGYRVTVLARSAAARARAEALLPGFARELAGLRPAPARADDWPERITWAADAAAAPALADCGVVLEAIREDAAEKAALLAALEALCPGDAIIASSTSGLPVAAIAAACRDPGRVAVAHFANPPHLMPLVEVVPGPATRPETLARLQAFLSSLGKETVALTQDLPGHLFNRLQFALLREAMALVARGVATPAEIDRVVKRGLALRLAEEGPLEKMDLAGLELVRDVARYLFPDLDRSTAPELLDRLLAEGRRGADWGRGFYDWTPEAAEALRLRRNTEVVRQLTKPPPAAGTPLPTSGGGKRT